MKMNLSETEKQAIVEAIETDDLRQIISVFTEVLEGSVTGNPIADTILQDIQQQFDIADGLLWSIGHYEGIQEMYTSAYRNNALNVAKDIVNGI